MIMEKYWHITFFFLFMSKYQLSRLYCLEMIRVTQESSKYELKCIKCENSQRFFHFIYFVSNKFFLSAAKISVIVLFFDLHCLICFAYRQQRVSGWWHQHHRRWLFDRLACWFCLCTLEEDSRHSGGCKQHPVPSNPCQGLQLPVWALAQVGQGIDTDDSEKLVSK